ncbi:MAG: hypothetical protein KA206_01940 [Paludibacter sp.]|nr:hypothetical protein [Paludibacter sp.]
MKQASLRISRISLFISILAIATFSSCKKDDDGLSDIKTQLSDLEKQQKWSKEIYDNMRDIYLWSTALPATFTASNYQTSQEALDYLSSLKIDPETNQPIDRYSFLDKIGSLSGEIEQGISSGDYGFMVQASLNSNDKVAFYVTYVYKNSPAGKAGVNRSYEITKINGSTNVNPEVGADGYLVTTSTGFTNMVNALFNSNTASFTFKKPSGSTIDVSLSTSKTYSINSILFDSIYTVDTKKVGYMVFNQFLGTPSQTELTNQINKFKTNGIKDIVIDLRYNGGGAVSTCDSLCNLLAPASASGKLMYKYTFNALLTDAYKNATDLVSYFNIKNTINLNNLYFIVSDNTASASELLINNLRPYYTDKLFLIGNTTYGKPCGFWATPIGYTEDQKTTKEGYDLYAVSFETRNANNEGDYYAGMIPGSMKYPGVIANDYIDLAWGDTNDECLMQALNHISTGTFVDKAQNIRRLKKYELKNQLNTKFRGMIDFRRKR